MSGPAIIVEPHPMGFRIYADVGCPEPSAEVIMDDEEEALDCARIMAGCTGWPIINRNVTAQ